MENNIMPRIDISKPNILKIERGLAAELKRLEQENKELQAYKDINEDFKKAWDELNEKYKQLRSALEEINITVKQLLQGVSSNCINNTPYLTALSLIENKINEVLK